MSRKPFYKVEKSVYLFPKQQQPDSERVDLEEPVRQWCAFELIRAYGICVSDIEFERQVRVGSKIYRIDISVLRHGRPWAMVECKEPNHAKHHDGMAQAISYANDQQVQAEFVIYTNGQTWNVQRRVCGQWVPVPDLPIPVGEHGQQSIEELLSTIHEVAPLFYKLDEPVQGDNAHKFFIAMQEFFNGWNLLTWGGNKDLHFGTEFFLRVLAVGKDDSHYCYSKLEEARGHYERFREQADYPFPMHPVDGQHSMSFEMKQLHTALLGMAEGTKELSAYDAYLLRLSVALLEYGRLWSSSKEPYPLVGANLHNSLREFLSYTLAVHLNISLPDTLDDMSTGDIKTHCKFAWDEIGKER